jgi:hypothetical protein
MGGTLANINVAEAIRVCMQKCLLYSLVAGRRHLLKLVTEMGPTSMVAEKVGPLKGKL